MNSDLKMQPSIEELAEDTIIEICNNLDVFSVVKFISSSKKIRKIKNRVNHRIEPYKNCVKTHNFLKGVTVAVKDGDNEAFKFFLKNNPKYDHALKKAAQYQRGEMIDFIMKHKRTEYAKYGLYGAARSGNKTLVDFFMNIIGGGYRGLNNIQLDYVLFKACRGGNKVIVEYIMELGAWDFETALRYAAKGGHKHIIDFIIEKGVDDVEDVLYGAAQSGNKEMVEYAIKLGAKKYDYAIVGAVEKRHTELVELFVEMGASWNNALIAAASYSHVDLIELYFEKGAGRAGIETPKWDDYEGMEIDLAKKAWQDGIAACIRLNNKKLVDKFIERCDWIIDWNTELAVAATWGRLELVKKFIQLGANDLKGALESSSFDMENEHVVDYLNEAIQIREFDQYDF